MTDIQQTIRRGVGRVAFLAKLDEFRRLIEAGWSIALIYEDRGISTGLSYSQFARYIGKYVRTPPTRNRSTKQPNTQPAMEEMSSEPIPPSLSPRPNTNPERPPARAGSTPKNRAIFFHDPNSGNNRDDLM